MANQLLLISKDIFPLEIHVCTFLINSFSKEIIVVIIQVRRIKTAKNHVRRKY
jgi:hypothetical protein